MSKINIDKIIEITNNQIGYENFKREENMKKKQIKKIFYVFMGVCILTIGVSSVNALTDNSITKAIDNLSKVKVNGKDYNSTCTEREDGSIICKVGETGVQYEISEEGRDFDYSFDITTSENDESITNTIEINEDKESNN